jgi:hypothetical protein
VANPATTDPDRPPEESPLEPAAPRPPKRRAWVYFLIGGLLFAAVTGPLVFYFVVFRYRPTAVKHVPAGTHIAVRFDGQSLYLFKPFRERVLHVLDDQPGVKSRGARLKALTGIDLRSDLREIVVASPDGHRWVVLLGGYFGEARFNRTDVVHGLRKFLEEQGKTGLVEKSGVLVTPEGIEITQTEDSTIVVANDDDLLHASLQPSDEWTNLGLVGSGAMSFTLDETALDHAKAELSGFDDAAVFAHTTRITGYLNLGASPELTLELVPRGTDSETLAKEADAALADAKLLSVFLPDVAGEQSALAAAKTRPRADVVMVTAPWPYDGLDRGMQKIGESAGEIFEKKAP